MSFQSNAFQGNAFQIGLTGRLFYFGNEDFWKVDSRVWYLAIEDESWYSTSNDRQWYTEIVEPGGTGKMAQAILQKRSYDSRIFDILCGNLLVSGATIATVNGVIADQGSLVFGSPNVNLSPVNYPNGTTAPTGTVIQVNISGGSMPPGINALQCTVRAQFTDSLGQNIEATVLLDYTDQVQS